MNDNQDDDDEQTRTRKGTWRLSTWDPEVKGHVKSEINLQHFCVAEGNLVRRFPYTNVYLKYEKQCFLSFFLF